MRLERRSVLRIGGVSLAGVVAGCADQGGDSTETDSTTTETTEPGGAVTDTETGGTDTETQTTTETATESPDGTTTEGTPGTTETATPEPEAEVVEMDGTAFVPMEVSIDPGTEVRWVNRDGIPHEVQSAQFNDGATEWEFDSEELGRDEETTYTFDEPGTYEYECDIHGASTMCGVVVVGDADRAGPLPCE